MTREWKPGDVALLQAGTSSERIGLRVADNDGWRTAVGLMTDRTCPPNDVHRPLVVIDPEDREAVERLAKVMHLSDVGENKSAPWDSQYPSWRSDRIDIMQAALREFADPKPPKPEEPMGLGAVVEDADGRKWIRTEDLTDPWSSYKSHDEDDYNPWSDIDAVTILSEGVR